MKNRLTALALTLIFAAVILIGCAAAAAEQNDGVEIKVTETGPMPTEAQADTILTREAAEAIALGGEGLTADQVTGLAAEYDADDGVREYDVEFRSGDYEYDITVNAETGRITSRDKEYDPVETAPAAPEPAATEKTTDSQSSSSGKSSSAKKDTSSGKAASSTKSNSSGSTITAEKAKSIALNHAGLSESQVTGLRAEYDVDDGVKEYDVDFRSGDYEYDYTINAETGKITSHDKEYDPVKTSTKATEPKATEPVITEAPAEELISASKAKSIALNHAGLSESQVTGLRCEYEIDDGVKEYEVDFRSGDYEYDYTINAESGKITSHDKEYDPVEHKPAETEPPATEAPAEELISTSKAKSIALSHAGLSSDEVRGMECEYDVDDGVKVYEVSFRDNNGYEYDYEINAVTGKIISWDKELDD